MTNQRSKQDVKEAGNKLKATRDMCRYCFEVLINELVPATQQKRKRQVVFPTPENLSCPIFVTWERCVSFSSQNYELRGCIGTLTPRPLSTSLREYVISSAFKDRRFEPIKYSELTSLRVRLFFYILNYGCYII